MQRLKTQNNFDIIKGDIIKGKIEGFKNVENIKDDNGNYRQCK